MLPWITDAVPTLAQRGGADAEGNIVTMVELPCGGMVWHVRPAHGLRAGTPWLPFSPPEPAESSPKPIPSGRVTMPPGRITRVLIPRKVQQIVYAPSGNPVVLADDGSLWNWSDVLFRWTPIQALPDREEEL